MEGLGLRGLSVLVLEPVRVCIVLLVTSEREDKMFVSIRGYNAPNCMKILFSWGAVLPLFVCLVAVVVIVAAIFVAFRSSSGRRYCK